MFILNVIIIIHVMNDFTETGHEAGNFLTWMHAKQVRKT